MPGMLTGQQGPNVPSWMMVVFVAASRAWVDAAALKAASLAQRLPEP